MNWYKCVETTGDGFGVSKHPKCIQSEIVGFTDGFNRPQNTIIVGKFTWSGKTLSGVWLIRTEEVLTEHCTELLIQADWNALFAINSGFKNSFQDQPF